MELNELRSRVLRVLRRIAPELEPARLWKLCQRGAQTCYVCEYRREACTKELQ